MLRLDTATVDFLPPTPPFPPFDTPGLFLRRPGSLLSPATQASEWCLCGVQCAVFIKRSRSQPARPPTWLSPVNLTPGWIRLFMVGKLAGRKSKVSKGHFASKYSTENKVQTCALRLRTENHLRWCFWKRASPWPVPRVPAG